MIGFLQGDNVLAVECPFDVLYPSLFFVGCCAAPFFLLFASNHLFLKSPSSYL